MKKSSNPIQGELQTCGAHARSTGEPCKNAPVTGSTRCRMHGGKGSGRPVVTGHHTKKAIEERRQMKELISSLNELVDAVDSGRT